MDFLNQIKYPTLYRLWAGLFAVTALLGFLFPGGEGILLFPLRILAVIFFLPPAAILVKCRQDGIGHHRKLIRNLSLASLSLTLILLCCSILSAGKSEALGNALHAALTVISAPMVCSNAYALSLFLWAMLLMGSLKKNTKKQQNA